MYCNSRCYAFSKKNFEIADERNIGLLIQIKENQDSLLKQVAHGCNRSKPLDVQEDPWEKGHGRFEQRTYEAFEASEILRKWPEWRHVKRIIRVTRLRERIGIDKKSMIEVSYYGSNRCLSIKEFAKDIREHWWCENKNHHVKDTAFQEDKTTKRIKAFNFAVLISIALNILRVNESENIRGDIYKNTMNFDLMISTVNYL